MVLRQIRWSVASLTACAAICLAPASSRADTQILVEEVSSSGTIVPGSVEIFPSTTSITTSLSNFTNITISVNPNQDPTHQNTSLTTTVNASPVSSGFDSTVGLRVIVTSDGFTQPNPGGNATVTNNASASSGIFAPGQNTLTASTQLLSDPLTTPVSSSGSPASGSVVLGSVTGATSDTRPNGGVSLQTTAAVNGVPGTFAIQQTIDVVASNVSSGSTLGGSASSTVNTSPVPAPGGLALALFGLPLVGARRLLRKRAA